MLVHDAALGAGPGHRDAVEPDVATVWRDETAEEGGLLGYGPRLPVCIQQVAALAGKVLKGAKPANLPVEQPSKFELAVNLKTAKAIGLTLPQSLLNRADQVIE